jgi:hypothetical protein
LANALADHGGVMTQADLEPYLGDIPRATPADAPPLPVRSKPAASAATSVPDLWFRGQILDVRCQDGSRDA